MPFVSMTRFVPSRMWGRRLMASGLLVALCITGIGCDAVGGDDTSAPSAPSTLQAESDDAQVVLNWSAVDADDLNGYNLYRSTSAIESVTAAEQVNEEVVSDTSFTDPSVENGTVYHYRVTAVDESDNESDPSTEVMVRPFDEPPRP